MKIIPNAVLRRISHRPNLVKIITNIGWLFVDKILRMGFGLLIGVWIARHLGPEHFGVFNLATAIVSIFSAIAGLGLQSIVIRDLVDRPKNTAEILGTAATLQLFGGLTAYLLTLLSIIQFRQDDTLLKSIAAILGSTLLLKATDIVPYWFESQVNSKYVIWVQNGVFLAFAAIKIVLLLNASSVIVFAWAAAAEAALTAIILCLVYKIRTQHLGPLSVTLSRAKQLLMDSWPLLFTGIAIMLYMKIDQIMLGHMIGNQAVGIYSAAVRLAEVWYFIPMGIVASVFPSILEAKTKSWNLYQHRIQQLFGVMTWLAIAVAVPMSFIAGPLVSALYGKEYESAGSVLVIYIWATIFVFLGVATSRWLVAENRQVLSLQRTLLGAIVNIAMNYLLIPLYGLHGAAWATVGAQFSANVLYDALQRETRPLLAMKIRSIDPRHLYQNNIKK